MLTECRITCNVNIGQWTSLSTGQVWAQRQKQTGRLAKTAAIFSLHVCSPRVMTRGDPESEYDAHTLAAADVTLINILNCHSCLVWSMDKPAELRAGGPTIEWVMRWEMGGTGPVLAEACRESRKALPGRTSELTLTDLVPGWTSERKIMTWQIINKHSRVISKAKLMNSFMFLLSADSRKYFIVFKFVFNERENNKQQQEIKRSFIKAL